MKFILVNANKFVQRKCSTKGKKETLHSDLLEKNRDDQDCKIKKGFSALKIKKRSKTTSFLNLLPLIMKVAALK